MKMANVCDDDDGVSGENPEAEGVRKSPFLL
jgi:hypothetical protein